VPSCKTCRPIVAQQLKGIEQAVAAFMKDAEQRAKQIERRVYQHAEGLHRYTQIVLAQLAAFQVDPARINTDYLEQAAYLKMQAWHRSLVRILVANRLDDLIAAKDERYTDADLDEDTDFELGPLLEARKAAAPASGDGADSASERDDAPPTGKYKSRAQQTRKGKQKVDKRKPQSKQKHQRGAPSRASGRPGKPVLREPTAADRALLDILVELSGIEARWAAIPAEVWAGAPTGFDFQLSEEADPIAIKAVETWDDLSEELRRLQTDNAE
jgi:hypothetical protein